MSTKIIARTSTDNAVNSKFERLSYRSDVGLNAATLHLSLGYALTTCKGALEAVYDVADHYCIDLFTRAGEAYSVMLVNIDQRSDTWSFYGSDEAYFVFCNWYTGVGGRARRAERIAA